jgi:hypothetical protein
MAGKQPGDARAFLLATPPVAGITRLERRSLHRSRFPSASLWNGAPGQGCLQSYHKTFSTVRLKLVLGYS